MSTKHQKIWEENRKKRWINPESRKKQAEIMKKYPPPMAGRKHTEESKKKMSEAHKGQRYSIPPRLVGKEHPNWKGGITPKNKKIRNSIEFRLWREAVFARDNWTCQKCNHKGTYLHPHHIQNLADYPELVFAIDNGITFCKDCHWDFHKKYGRRNNTKEQLGNFFREVNKGQANKNK